MNEQKEIALDTILGTLVRDRISLFEGVVDEVIEELNCVDRVSIQPQGDGKEYPRGAVIDITGIEIVGEKRVLEVATPVAKHGMGIFVKCGITGFSGTIVAIRKMINGCVGYVLAKEFDKMDGMISNRPVIRHMVLEPNLVVDKKPEKVVEHKPTEKGCSVSSKELYCG